VLEQLIEREVMAQAAEARGIVASDSEVAELLKKNPDFQKDGKFDLDTYKSVMSQYYRRLPRTSSRSCDGGSRRRSWSTGRAGSGGVGG